MEPVVVPPGQGRVLEEHVHDGEDATFFIIQGEMTFTFSDRRIGLAG